MTSSAAAGLALASAPLGARAAAARQPFGRSGPPRLRLSLAAYSFAIYYALIRGQPNPRIAEHRIPADRVMDLFRFIDFCRDHGCDGAELTSYFFTEDTEAHMIQLRRHCFLRGLAVSGTAIGNNFAHAPGPQREAEIARTKLWIDRAAALGTSHVRVFGGVNRAISRVASDRLIIDALAECCDYAGRRGIFLGLENHDQIGTAAALLAMVKAVGSPWLGINLDSGNFTTEDPYQDFAACVPHAVNVQLKTQLGRGTTQGERPADLRRLIGLLREGGYQGWVALEFEERVDPWLHVPRVLTELKALCA